MTAADLPHPPTDRCPCKRYRMPDDDPFGMCEREGCDHEADEHRKHVGACTGRTTP